MGLKGGNMKKIFTFIFMFMMLFMKVNASEHLDLVPISGVYSSQFNMDTGAYFSSNQKIYYMDGKVVYCVEPGVGIYTNDYDGVADLYLSNISQDIIDKVSLIGYFGYDYPGHGNYRYFLAAQELIWELIGNNEIHFTTGINDTGDIVNIDYEKNEIMGLVNRFYLKPSFDNISVDGKYNDSIVLTDTNDVLSNYTVSSNNSVFIDGNKLVIKFDSLGSDNILLSRKKYDDMPSVFYHADGSQDFMFLRASGEVTSNISVNSYIPYSNIHIDKKGMMLDGIDSDNNFIYSLRGLDGVLFELYANEDIYVGERLVYSRDQLVQELSTINGEVTSDNLPNGNYYLKEVKTASGFILNDSIINIHLENEGKEVYTHMIDLKNERQKIFINLSKHGEVFNGIVDNSGDYINVPLANIKFGLYSGNDIYDVDGDLLVKKNVLIRELITDSSGNIDSELNIPFGTYYLKELETLPGYILDPNIYEFSVSDSSDGIVKIMVTKEPIINSISKSRLVINKIDENGNKLKGALFKVFDSLNNLIYEGATDENGVISIENLGYGKYYFYEVSAPNGYILSDKIYEIFVNNDDDFICVNVLNQSMPITSDIYSYPKKLSTIGLGFGLLTLSLTVLYDKKYKNN